MSIKIVEDIEIKEKAIFRVASTLKEEHPIFPEKEGKVDFDVENKDIRLEVPVIDESEESEIEDEITSSDLDISDAYGSNSNNYKDIEVYLLKTDTQLTQARRILRFHFISELTEDALEDLNKNLVSVSVETDKHSFVLEKELEGDALYFSNLFVSQLADPSKREKQEDKIIWMLVFSRAVTGE